MYLKLLATLSLVASANPVNLSCSSIQGDFGSLKKAWHCVVKNDFEVTVENEEVSYNLTLENKFEGIMAEKKLISYLPKGIGKCCMETKILVIKASKLKDITSDNLRNLTELVHLDLSHNELRILEGDLFCHNLRVERIHLNNNKIFAIASTVFDNLSSLRFLTLKENVCRPLEASAEGQQKITKMTKQFKTDRKCWKEVPQTDIKITRLEIKLEKIDANILKHVSNSQLIENITHSVQQSKDLHKSDVSELKKEIIKVKRSANDTDTFITENFKSIQTLIETNKADLSQKLQNVMIQNENILLKVNNTNEICKQANNISKEISWALKNFQTSAISQMNGNISTIINENNEKNAIIVEDISKNVKTIPHLETSINELKFNIISIRDQATTIEDTLKKSSQLQTKIQKETSTLNQKIEKINLLIESKSNFQNAGNENSDFGIIGFINTLLLLIIIAVLLFIIFRDRQNQSISSRPVVKPLPIEPTENTTITQLEDDYSPIEPRHRDYEPFPEAQNYESVTKNEIQNKAKRSSVFIPNDVSEYECQGFMNDIYGTASAEDLYSEVISPKRMPSKEKIDDNSEVYAVVFKPQREY